MVSLMSDLTPEAINRLLHEAEGWDADAVARHAMSALDTIHRLARALSVLVPTPANNVRAEAFRDWLLRLDEAADSIGGLNTTIALANAELMRLEGTDDND
jgi:hypothetical protein